MPNRPAKLQYVLLALAVLGSMFFYLISTAAVFDGLIHYAERARAPFDFSNDPHFLARPLPEALKAGIRPDDQIISVNGVLFTGMARLFRQAFYAHPGQTFVIVYRNPGGQILTARVPLTAPRPTKPNLSRWLIRIALEVIFPGFCLLLGYWVVIARPRGWNAWFFLGVMSGVPVFLGHAAYFPGFLTPFTVFWQNIALGWMFVSLTLLAIYFPVRSRIDSRYPWVKWLILVPQILTVPLNMLLAYGQLYRIRFIQPYLAAAAPLNTAGNVFAALSLILFIGAVIRKLLTVPTPDARRRLGVVAAGSLLGLTPVLVILLLTTFTNKSFNEVMPPWSLLVAAVLFAIFPLSLAYTVIVQRALDVRIFLRQGTRYAFARGTLWGLQVFVFCYLGYRLMRFNHEAGHRLMHLIAAGAFVVAVLFLRLRIAKPLSLWIDRRFFREAYSVEQVLSDLSVEARTFTETGPLLRTILDRISQTLHVESLSVLLRNGPVFRLQYAQGLPETIDVCLPENSSTIRALARTGTPARVRWDDPDPWLSLASPAEVSVLQELHAELMLPLPGRSSLIGVMTVGLKRSEEPYSSSDRRLLQSVALQTGLAIENSELIHHLAEEAAHRESMKREIEIAREVQERLFPQVYPVLPGIDLAGACRTAQEVGGDYYDFIALQNGRLGIAIGDVSGKGISAALLMASIRATLRALTLNSNLDLASLMQQMNQVSYDSSTSNRFATFFFAEYDPSTRMLDYVNAGHNAPALLRASNGFCGQHDACQVQRLEIGGPVMGIFPEAQYEQGRVALEPNDVLIAFTDGISEAMNAAQEEWSEERVIVEAQKCIERPARDIVSFLIDGADRFTAGAPQNDDLTLVVIKVS